MRAKEKADEEKRAKEEAALLKTVQVPQKVPFGVDPSTVLCVYFKSGSCEKGSKCKFSHDLNVGRKVEKKNLYDDGREDKLNGNLHCHPTEVTEAHLKQILWRIGTKKNSGTLSSQNTGTLEQQQM